MTDARSPDKIIVSGIFLWFLLRMPDASSPADPIVFTASMFMFLYPGRQLPVRRIKSLEYFCVFFSGRRMPVRRQIPLSSQNQCSSSFTQPRMPDAGLPDKIIGIFLWLLLRTPDAGSPADPIVFTESMFMFLYPAQDAKCRFAG